MSAEQVTVYDDSVSYEEVKIIEFTHEVSTMSDEQLKMGVAEISVPEIPNDTVNRILMSEIVKRRMARATR